MYGLTIGINSDDIYKQLTPSEKERFEDVVITEVKRTGNEITIEAIVIEKKNYDEEKYKKLLDEETTYLEEDYMPSNGTPPRRHLL